MNKYLEKIAQLTDRDKYGPKSPLHVLPGLVSMHGMDHYLTKIKHPEGIHAAGKVAGAFLAGTGASMLAGHLATKDKK